MGIFVARATFTPGNLERVVQGVVRDRLVPAVQRSQKIVAENARRDVAVLTGELRESITTYEPVDDGKNVTGTIAAEADHAGFVEFGTGLRGEGTYPGELPTEGVPITGEWVYDYRGVGYQGRPADPFMRPALDNSRDDVMEEFRK